MAEWKYELDLRDVWDKRNGECGAEDWTDKTVHELAKEVARRLERKFPFITSCDDDIDTDLCDLIGYFRDVPTYPEWKAAIAECDAEGHDADPIRYYTPLREFNDLMKELYDWADDNRMWIKR